MHRKLHARCVTDVPLAHGLSNGHLYGGGWEDECKMELFTAVREGTVEQVRSILEQTIDINIRNEAGRTPLMCAAQRGNPEIVRLMLEHEAYINASDLEGCTPLILAVRTNTNTDVVSVLLDAGADTLIRSRELKNALDYAIDNPAIAGTDQYQRLHQAFYG